MLVLYWIVLIFFGFFVPIFLTVYAFFAILGDFMGAPFVPTQQKMIAETLKRAKLKKGQFFLELGSGDGRVTRMAAKEYGVVGEGIEMHPLLVFYSNFLAKRAGLRKVHFKRGNFFSTDLSRADVLFLFLLPETLVKLREKFLKECKKGTLIISHGFKIKGMEKNLVDTVKRPLFSSFYYKI